MQARSVCALAALCLALAACGGGAASSTLRTLVARSCVGAWCVEVGQEDLGAIIRPLVVVGGRASALPLVGRSSELLGVACLSQRFCMAVGSEPVGALAELWDGRVWHRLDVPQPTGDAILSGVSCPDASFCIAVGATRYGQALIESWDGAGWSRMAIAAASPGETDPLAAVSCTAAAACVAVGTSFTPLIGQEILIERLLDGGWSELTPPTATAPSLLAISCVGTAGRTPLDPSSWCLATGVNGAGATRTPLAVVVAGTAVADSPVPQTRGAALSEVSCGAVGDCRASGLAGAGARFAAALRGGSWAVIHR
jgi:hypothetical protein